MPISIFIRNKKLNNSIKKNEIKDFFLLSLLKIVISALSLVMLQIPCLKFTKNCPGLIIESCHFVFLATTDCEKAKVILKCSGQVLESSLRFRKFQRPIVLFPQGD